MVQGQDGAPSPGARRRGEGARRGRRGDREARGDRPRRCREEGKRSNSRGGHRPFAATKPGASIAALARRTRAQDKRRGLDPDP